MTGEAIVWAGELCVKGAALQYAIIDAVPTTKPWLRWTSLAAALVVLDASITFQNVWPTPAIRWRGTMSIELAAFVAILLAARRVWGAPSARVLRWLSAVWVGLVLGHYAEVTAPALYGRDLNLYWDLRFVPAVVALLAQPERWWLVVLAVGGAALIIGVLYGLLRWAIGRVGIAIADQRERRALGVLAATVAALFVVPLGSRAHGTALFSDPVIAAYVRQTRLMVATLDGSRSLPPSPVLDSDLSLVGGADVFVVFIESYGAVSFDRPAFSTPLTAPRHQLEAAIHDTHRDVVSAYFESSTFGGSSWLAHISLLSGVDVRDHETNALLMTQRRDTLVTAFKRHGYRTVALMPGTWQDWPEGSFYGFDDIYGGARLNYHGPQFGWWDIPDQFAIARLDALEVNRNPRAPLFVLFPTISSHIPFTPTPPYQPAWSRMLTEQPYDDVDIERAFDRQPDWLDLGPSYVNALSYTYQVISGYLRQRADRDFIMILLGDHQPPAAVSGEGAPWDVPVHVIANRRQVLDRLLTHGFRRGLEPARPTAGRLNTLAPILLEVFGDREAAVSAARELR